MAVRERCDEKKQAEFVPLCRHSHVNPRKNQLRMEPATSPTIRSSVLSLVLPVTAPVRVLQKKSRPKPNGAVEAVITLFEPVEARVSDTLMPKDLGMLIAVEMQVTEHI